ncbi:hypothetical protein BHE74_00006470 [Ensete ventricosum]|uniref:Uncharacterized protein n=1 Tax=Ensete ventricosum TaxID=4639 RepID=A0A445MAP9_ENSVE|nr:hypothetical protein BHE74_00006470 [Ensete ventricosum]RZR71335.1 hypothetical protein BHM03_00004708 [Ensete ventricosum]
MRVSLMTLQRSTSRPRTHCLRCEDNLGGAEGASENRYRGEGEEGKQPPLALLSSSLSQCQNMCHVVEPELPFWSSAAGERFWLAGTGVVVGKLSGSSSKVSAASVPPTPRSEGEILQSVNVKSFTFSELRIATRNFRPDSVVGEGGFGSVFKGWIDEHTLAAAKPGTGVVIAVKKLNQEGYQGHREWLVSIILLCALSLTCHGHLTTKSDVYSFGVVLLELLSGRRAVDKNRPTGEHNLVEWARPYLTSKRKIFRILDSRLGGQYSLAGAQKAAVLALQCLSSEARYRPTMDQVVAALEQLQDAKDTERSPQSEQKSSGQSIGSNSHRSLRRRSDECAKGKVARHRPPASPLCTK